MDRSFCSEIIPSPSCSDVQTLNQLQTPQLAPAPGGPGASAFIRFAYMALGENLGTDRLTMENEQPIRDVNLSLVVAVLTHCHVAPTQKSGFGGH